MSRPPSEAWRPFPHSDGFSKHHGRIYSLGPANPCFNSNNGNEPYLFPPPYRKIALLLKTTPASKKHRRNAGSPNNPVVDYPSAEMPSNLPRQPDSSAEAW